MHEYVEHVRWEHPVYENEASPSLRLLHRHPVADLGLGEALGELGDARDYEVTITADPYGDSSCGPAVVGILGSASDGASSSEGRQRVWILTAPVEAELVSG